MTDAPLVCDTTIFLYLDRVGLIGLLPRLFGPICAPYQVALELDMGRMLRQDTLDPRILTWLQIVEIAQDDLDRLPSNRLGSGERAVIAHAISRGSTAGLDDRLAREFAESLGLHVIGIVGLLLRAKEAKLLEDLRPHLDHLRSQGFHLGEDVYREALHLANEAL